MKERDNKYIKNLKKWIINTYEIEGWKNERMSERENTKLRDDKWNERDNNR